MGAKFRVTGDDQALRANTLYGVERYMASIDTVITAALLLLHIHCQVA